MSEVPENLYFNSRIGLPTTHKLVESDVTYIRSDMIEKRLAEQREAISELKQALEFFDKVNALAVGRTSVGRGHWDWVWGWLLSAARKVVEVSDG